MDNVLDGNLSTAVEAAKGLQGGQIEREKMMNQTNAGAAERAQQTNLQNNQEQNQEKLNASEKVTITPQLAKGLKDSTGDDSWLQAMGTKMDPRIYSSLLTMGVKAKHDSDLINDRDKLEEMREQARAKAEAAKAAHAKELEDDKIKGRSDLESKRTKGKIDAKGKGKEETPEAKKEKASKLLNDISKSKDESSKQALIGNYNSIAKDLGMSPYEPGATDQMKEALGGMVKGAAHKIAGMFGGGGQPDPKMEAAKKFLTDHNLPVTDANIQHYQDKYATQPDQGTNAGQPE